MRSTGQTAMLRGNFTMLGFIAGFRPADLERRIGFHPGRLSKGFAIVALANGQRLSPSEIELQGSTRWSGGFSGNTPALEGTELESLLRDRGQDISQIKEKVCSFFAKGGARIPAKVLPVVEHAAGMQYPDANAIGPGIRGGVPQFNLLVPRLFSVVSVWSPAEA